MKLPLFPEQEKDVEFAISHTYCILALAMGTGKTAISICAADKIGGKVLIIVPAYLTLNWKLEIEKFVGWADVVRVKKGSDKIDYENTRAIIISYDLAIKNEKLFEWADIVICDEADALKSMKAKRTQAIHKMVYENSIKRLMLLTGTPIRNRVQEFYSLIALCNYRPDLKHSEFLEEFPDDIGFADRYSYREEFEKDIGYKRIKIVRWSGLRNEDELKDWLRPFYTSRKSTRPESRVKFLMTSDVDDKELKLAFDSFTEENNSVAPDIKAKVAEEKVPFTIKYAEDIVESIGCPIIIFSDHREPVKRLAQHFGVPAITGEMPAGVRAQIAADFQGGKYSVLVATIGSFSTGVTLTRANQMIFNDICWTSGGLEQAKARINRIGQDKECFVHFVFGSPQDRYIWETVVEKKKVIEGVM